MALRRRSDTIELIAYEAVKCLVWQEGPASVLGREIDGGPVVLSRNNEGTYKAFKITDLEYQRILRGQDLLQEIRKRPPEYTTVQSIWIQWTDMTDAR